MQYFSENTEELKKANALAMEITLEWRGDFTLPESMRDYPEEFKGQCENLKNPFTIYFLSDVAPPFGLWARCHGHIDAGRLVYFYICLERKPINPTSPADVAKISERLGGYPNGLNVLFSELQGRSGLCRAKLELFFEKSPFKFSRRKIAKEISPFKAKSERLNLASPDGTELAISLLEKGGSMVSIGTKFELEMNQECFNIACKRLNDTLSPLQRV